MVTAQRVGIQLLRARGMGSRPKSHDLAREAVSCNAVLACNLASCLRKGFLQGIGFRMTIMQQHLRDRVNAFPRDSVLLFDR